MKLSDMLSADAVRIPLHSRDKDDVLRELVTLLPISRDGRDSTLLGGTSVDQGAGIAVDASGNAYVTGFTDSTNFPTTSPPLTTPFQATSGGVADAFVTKLNPAGSALVYSTYLGGTGDDSGNCIAVDPCFAGYPTARDDQCLSVAEARAFSSPIFVDFRVSDIGPE